MRYKEVDPKPEFFKIDEKILTYWKKNKIFEKSISQKDKNNTYSFYDGPPFVTGVPHYGSLLSSIAKDVVPRYWTMKGKRIRRVWGWDCHGLPIENKVEEKLKIKRKKDIEKIGIKKFIDECYKYVATTSPEWEWYIDHVGRWVDFKNAYRTMDKDYMETVIWGFKQIYDKGLIYQGKRISLFCPHCSTPVSNFEIAMDNSYIDITEPSNVYKYQLEEEKDTYVLAWSTTPWNKIVTPALAINPNYVYLKVKQGNEYYILAKKTLKMLEGKYEIVDEFKGKKLERIKFVPHYDFYNIKDNPNTYRVFGADFVTAEEGTGVVTIAAYGEDDYKLMLKKNIPILEHVDEEGYLKKEIKPWVNMYYLEVNKKVNEDLKRRNLLYSEKPYSHSVPVCWRCKTRLIYAPQNAWFIKVSELKKQMLETNKKINWVPKFFKSGRFKKGIENAPDWCISRTRYWGSPMPVWICDCGEKYIIGSIKELEKLSGKKVTDLHRPFIDSIKIKCLECKGMAKRVPDVLDSWVESGSMPYAERHYPFENVEEFKKSFPADFISEYVAQTRAWFYVMHVISNALFNTNSFKNVVVTGVIMGTDGRKMSKSYGNYPDPKKSIEKYGGDSLRLYLMGSQLMIGQDINISEQGMIDTIKTTLLPLWNVYRYFISYANLHKFQVKQAKPNSNNILDKWIFARFKQFKNELNKNMDSYYLTQSVRLIQPFINDLSTWYIRRSRERFVAADKEALETLNYILFELIKLIAPIAPFISEEIFLNIKPINDCESVHLCNYPLSEAITESDNKLLKEMELVREICFLGNSQRKIKALKVRQPLAKAIVHSSKISKIIKSSLDKEKLEEIIKNELNIKKVVFKDGEKLKVTLDTVLTPSLKEEGEVREFIRKVQAARKKLGCNFEEKVNVYVSSWPENYSEEIKKKALIVKLIRAREFKVERLK